MKKRLTALIFTLATSAWADAPDDGGAAYAKGDYKTAFSFPIKAILEWWQPGWQAMVPVEERIDYEWELEQLRLQEQGIDIVGSVKGRGEWLLLDSVDETTLDFHFKATILAPTLVSHLDKSISLPQKFRIIFSIIGEYDVELLKVTSEEYFIALTNPASERELKAGVIRGLPLPLKRRVKKIRFKVVLIHN